MEFSLIAKKKLGAVHGSFLRIEIFDQNLVEKEEDVATIWGDEEYTTKLANMFVASPDMLEALKALVTGYDAGLTQVRVNDKYYAYCQYCYRHSEMHEQINLHDEDCEIEMARKVIAKAEGRDD